MANETTDIEVRDEILGILEAEFTVMAKHHTDEPEGLSWVPEWLLGKLARIEAAEADIKKRYRELINHCGAEARALFYRYGDTFRSEVDKAMAAQGGKAKSISLLTGRAGYRKSAGRLDIVDVKAAAAWAIDNLERDELIAAIASLNKTPLLAHVETTDLKEPAIDFATGEEFTTAVAVPDGCVYHLPEERFYPAPPQRQLTMSKSKLKELEEGR